MKYLSNQNFQCPISTPSLQITGGSSTDGIFTWNSTDETIDVTLGSSTGQLFEEEYIHVKNTSGSLIPDRTAVRKVGTDGMSGHILIAPMIADGSVSPNDFLGITTNDIANGGFGKVTTFGKINGVDTSIWPDNTDLWLDPTVPGGFTSTKPAAPNLKINPAYVVASHAVNGKIFVRANSGIDLHNNHRIQILSPDANGNPQVDGQLLRWNDTLNRWENWTSNYLTPSNVSGTTNYISKFTGTNTLGNSQIFDNGTNVGIGTLLPDSKLHIEGTTTGTGSGADAIVHIKQNGGWNGNEPWALYVEGYSYLNGFRINAADGQRGLHTTSAQLGFSVEGDSPISFTQSVSVYRMYIAPGGNIGIGTTSPATKLQVAPASAYTSLSGDGLSIWNPAISSANIVLGFNGSATNSIQSRDGSSGTYGLSLNPFGGNVGIGTTSPGRKLDINTDGGLGNANNYLRLSASAAGAYSFNSYIEGYYNDYGNGELARIGLIHFEGTRPGSNNVGGNIKFYTKTLGGLNTADPTVKMTITADGNVGVGTTAPTEKVHILGADNTNLLNVSGASGKLRIKGYLSSTYGTLLESTITSGTLMPMTFSASKILLLDGGVSINTTSNTAQLQIKGSGSTSATTSLLVQNSSGTTALSVRDDLLVSTGGGLAVAGSISLGTNQGIGDGNFSLNVNRLESYNSYNITTLVQNRSIALTPGNTPILWANYWAGGNYAGVVVQDTVGTSQSTSAVLQANSTTRGFLPPRMTNTQVNAISTPATGLQVYDTTNNKNMLYNGSSWQSIATESYVTTQITNLINGAPTALDTLNELAAALGNDANFATTVTNSLASKVANTRTLTINGTSYDLSADRSWTIPNDLQTAVNGSKVTTPVNTGATVVASFSVSSYDGATFNYVLKDGTNFRAGTVVAVWNGATVQYNETTTNDIGNTTSVVLSVAISAGNAELIATSGTPGWTMKVVPIGI